LGENAGGEEERAFESVMSEPYYTCNLCQWNGSDRHFIIKVRSIMYRSKHDNIQMFSNITCPKCHNVVTIVFETLDCEVKG